MLALGDTQEEEKLLNLWSYFSFGIINVIIVLVDELIVRHNQIVNDFEFSGQVS